MTEKTLSDEIQVFMNTGKELLLAKEDFIFVKDVKKAIQRLKNHIHCKRTHEIINKIFGEKLTVYKDNQKLNEKERAK